MTGQPPYKELSSVVKKLKRDMKQAARAKEQWFRKKESLKEDIKVLSKDLKSLRSQRGEMSSELKSLKKERDKYNAEVKELISKIKKVGSEREKVRGRYSACVNPEVLLKKISALEEQVEVEVDFKKEKKLMEEIKKLKKQYDEVSLVGPSTEKDISQNIKESRKKADSFHKKLQEVSEQGGSDDFKAKVNKLQTVKKEQEDAFQKFIDEKNRFLSIQKELKVKQKELAPLEAAAEEKKEEKKKAKAEAKEKVLEEETKKVEEKLKSKKRLTKEDLLAFQGSS